ncbi:MAG: TrbC/VirB2 family protein [Ginsengibacter sp.]
MVVRHDSARVVVVVLAILCLALVTAPVLASIHDLSQPWKSSPNNGLEFINSPWVIIIQVIFICYVAFALVRGGEMSDFTRLIIWFLIGSFIISFVINVLLS